jgi:hypothetical protein
LGQYKYDDNHLKLAHVTPVSEVHGEIIQVTYTIPFSSGELLPLHHGDEGVDVDGGWRSNHG